MLINIRVSELISDTSNSIPLSIIAILIFYIPLSNILPNTRKLGQLVPQLEEHSKKIDTFSMMFDERNVFYVSSNN
jgi:hypothetical protein